MFIQYGGSPPTKKCLKKQRKYKGHNKSPLISRNSNNKCTECNSRKPNTCFKCGSEGHFFANFLKPDTSDKKAHWNKENPKTFAYIFKKIDKALEKSEEKRELKQIYSSMLCIYSNADISRRHFGDR